MLTFPQEFEKILLQYIKTNYLSDSRDTVKRSPFNDKDLLYFSKGAARLSDGFTEDRGTLPTNYFNDPVLRSGYLLYFLPVNFLKIVRIMQEFSAEEITDGKIRVLDVGSGPGTAMLGLMAFYADLLKEKKLKDAWLDFTLIDQNHTILKDALSLHREYSSFLEKENKSFRSLCSVKHFDFRRGGLRRFLRNFRYHLIVVGNVINEFPDRESQTAFVESLIAEHLAPNGKLILIEPALKKTSRDLQNVRDQIVVNHKTAFVHSPCLHQELCPLNVVNKRDWCHFYFSWKRPDFISRVDKIIGNQKDWLACSFLVLAKEPRQFQKIFPRPENAWRVISNRIPTKGKEEFVLCGPSGRYHVTRLDKDAGPPNFGWNGMRRGDLVTLNVRGTGHQVEGEFQVQKNDRVDIVQKI